MKQITVAEFFDENKIKLGLSILSGKKILAEKNISVSDISRPGLAIAGYFEYFPADRIQVFGMTEFSYLKTLVGKKAEGILKNFFSYGLCCVIVARGLRPPKFFFECAEKFKTPLLGTNEYTTKVISSSMIYLERKFAPKVTVHGTLVDVCGVGVMITGKSGIGKSEVSLELVKRGHRLITDDIIEITKSGGELVGAGAGIIKHHMEIRGVGIIDIKKLFGAGAVEEEKEISLNVYLESWAKGKEYERLGIEEKYEEILGVKMQKITIPVRPGRNLSVIIEAAAMNRRLKHMGTNTAKEVDERIINVMKKAQL